MENNAGPGVDLMDVDVPTLIPTPSPSIASKPVESTRQRLAMDGDTSGNELLLRHSRMRSSRVVPRRQSMAVRATTDVERKPAIVKHHGSWLVQKVMDVDAVSLL